MAVKTGGQAAVETLIAHGVDTLFGLISIHLLDLYDALRERSDEIRFIGCRNEAAAAYMAYGYARATGKPGVVLTSTGPGAANAMGALGEAYHGSVPVLHITTDVAPEFRNSGKGATHEPENQLEMFRSVTSFGTFVDRPADISGAIFEAFEHMKTNRPRPADVEIATTALGQSDDVEILGPRHVELARPSPESVRAAADLLGKAKRPMILAGGGVNFSPGGAARLAAFAERIGAPVLTSPGGKGVLPDDHPLALGVATSSRSLGLPNPALDTLMESDAVLAVGTRLRIGNPELQDSGFAENLIHLDIDPDVIGKNHAAAVAMIGDLTLGLDDLEAELDSRGIGAVEGTNETCAALRRANNEALEQSDFAGPFMPMMDAIGDVLPRDAIVVVDVTVPFVAAVRRLNVYGPNRYITPHGWSGVGTGLPAGLGAAAGRPDVPVLILHGDGGFQFNMQELGTAVQYGLNPTIVVFNDGGWGILKWAQDFLRDGRRYGVDLVNPDFQALAAAYGIKSARVEDVASFKVALGDALSSRELRLIEVVVNEPTEPIR